MKTRPRRASSKRPSRPKPKGNGQPIRTRGSLANGRTVEGAWGQSRVRVPSRRRRGRPRRAGVRFLCFQPRGRRPGETQGGGGVGEGGGARGREGGGSSAGRFRLRCLVVRAPAVTPVWSPSASLSLAVAGVRRGGGGGCNSTLGCMAAAAATSVSVAAASGPSSCTCGCARDWSVRCCVVSGRGVGGRCGRCVSAGGGGSGGGRGSGWSAVVVGISGGASGSGRAAAPGSSALRRVVRWKDSATVSCRFDDSAVAVVAA